MGREKRDSVEIMMRLIRFEITAEPLPEWVKEAVDEDILKRLYRLSKAHDVAHIVGSALKENGLLTDNKISENYRKQILTAVYRYEQLSFELAEIKRALHDAKIPFIALKGATLRQYYLKPYIRTSSDVDILIKKEDLVRAEKELINALSYEHMTKSAHDISLKTPSGMHVELHFDLIEDSVNVNGKADKPLKKVWNDAVLFKSSEYAMTNELFY